MAPKTATHGRATDDRQLAESFEEIGQMFFIWSACCGQLWIPEGCECLTWDMPDETVPTWFPPEPNTNTTKKR